MNKDQFSKMIYLKPEIDNYLILIYNISNCLIYTYISLLE